MGNYVDVMMKVPTDSMGCWVAKSYSSGRPLLIYSLRKSKWRKGFTVMSSLREAFQEKKTPSLLGIAQMGGGGL